VHVASLDRGGRHGHCSGSRPQASANTAVGGRGTMIMRNKPIISGLVSSALACMLSLAGCSGDVTSSNGAARGGSGGIAKVQSGAGGAKAGAGGMASGGAGHAGVGVGAGAGTAGTGAGAAGTGAGAGAAGAGAGAGAAGAGAGAGAGAAGAGAGAAGTGAAGTAGCTGSAPQCRGFDLRMCCGQDPYGPATCENGEWMCSLFGSAPVAAPGCNGRYSCTQASAGAAGEGGGN
jgi:hypothetical protein